MVPQAAEAVSLARVLWCVRSHRYLEWLARSEELLTEDIGADIVAFIAELLPGQVMRGVPRAEWEAAGIDEAAVRRAADENTRSALRQGARAHRRHRAHPRRRLAAGRRLPLPGKHRDGAGPAPRAGGALRRRHAHRPARPRRHADHPGRAARGRNVRAAGAAGVARVDEPVLARGAAQRRRHASAPSSTRAAPRRCCPGSTTERRASGPRHRRRSARRSRLRASSRRAAITVIAASAAAPSTPPPMRTALRSASPPPGAGSDGPWPNHTVTAVCSARVPLPCGASPLDAQRCRGQRVAVAAWSGATRGSQRRGRGRARASSARRAGGGGPAGPPCRSTAGCARGHPPQDSRAAEPPIGRLLALPGARDGLDHRARIAAALRGAIAAQPQQDGGAGLDMLAVAELLAANGGLDVDDLRQRQLSTATAAGLLVRVLPVRAGHAAPTARGCAVTPTAARPRPAPTRAPRWCASPPPWWPPTCSASTRRPRRSGSASHCSRTRPMALLNRLAILDADAEVVEGDADPGAALQVALSELEWTGVRRRRLRTRAPRRSGSRRPRHPDRGAGRRRRGPVRRAPGRAARRARRPCRRSACVAGSRRRVALVAEARVTAG